MREAGEMPEAGTRYGQASVMCISPIVFQVQPHRFIPQRTVGGTVALPERAALLVLCEKSPGLRVWVMQGSSPSLRLRRTLIIWSWMLFYSNAV